MIQSLLQDLRYGGRLLCRDRAFTAAAILALALGIGVNTAVFTAWKAMVARPLDARDAGRMVNVAILHNADNASFRFTYRDYVACRDSVRSFSGVAAFSMEQMRLSGAGGMVSDRDRAAGSFVGRVGLALPAAARAEFATVYLVSENYFDVLGVPVIRGQAFDSMPARQLSASPSVLISENYWQKRFAGDASIVGRTVRLNSAAVTIIGITPHDYTGTGITVPDFWVPLTLDPLLHRGSNRLEDPENLWCRMFARLAPGVSITQARAEMQVVADRLRALHVPHSESAKPGSVLLWPGSPFPLPITHYRGLVVTFVLIMASALMVLSVACANVACLQLARARSRRLELHTRLSLGASRMRLVRQMLTESAVLAVLAGVCALLCTWALLRLAAAFAFQLLPPDGGTPVFHVTPDLATCAWVFTVSLAAALLFGTAPALESSRSALASAERNSTATVRGRRVQDLLVGVQVALSLVLLLAGSMFVHSAIHTLKTPPGYETERVVSLELRFPEDALYTTARKANLLIDVRLRLAALPDVARIASGSPPGSGFRTAVAATGLHIMHYVRVEPGYFQTLGIPVLLGRGFEPSSRQADSSVVLSESAARELFPGRDPIGGGIRLGPTDEQSHPTVELIVHGPARQVIGIARDVRGFDLNGSDSRLIYLPLPEPAFAAHPLLIRTRGNPAHLLKEIDSQIAAIDPDLVATASTLQDALRRSPSFFTASLGAAVASMVGLIGLFLAVMGIYATVRYIVALRTREIGIRMAVGGQRRDIVSLVLRESTRPVAG